MKDKKSILVIIVLVILLGLSVAYIILGPNGYRTTEKGKNFFDDVIELQSNLSYYVGAAYSDSFGVYSKEELLLGKTEDGEKIKDNEDNLLPTLVEEDSKESYDKDSNAYKLNMDNVKTTLRIKTGDYEGVTFYVVDGDLIKVKLDGDVEWWNNNYDGLLLK
jgi:hypothetical protein